MPAQQAVCGVQAPVLLSQRHVHQRITLESNAKVILVRGPVLSTAVPDSDS